MLLMCSYNMMTDSAILQVNDTELFPAIKTTFEDPDSENSEMVESLFDHKESHHQDSEAHEQENAQNEAQVRDAVRHLVSQTPDAPHEQPKRDITACAIGRRLVS